MMRRLLLFVVTAALTLPVSALVQARGQGPTVKRPDFSGKWNYEAPAAQPGARGRSNSPRVGGLLGGGYTNWGPAAPTLVITQSANEITLDRGPGETKWVYKLDGTENTVPDPTNKEAGGPYPFKTKAQFDGNRLILYTRQGLQQQRDILTLNGNVLNITRDTETPPGSGIDIKLVYNKAS